MCHTTLVNVFLQSIAIISTVLVCTGDARTGHVSVEGTNNPLRHGRSINGQIGLGEPYFAESLPNGPNQVLNVTAQLGITTYLHCKVNSLAGKTVSWLKRHDDTPHLLTFGLTTYSNDARFQIFHEQPNDWKLQIQFPQLSDQGIYECMVSANPPLIRRLRLQVVVPEIEIVDERDKQVAEKYYKGGSTIELKCIVKQIVGQAPEYIIWHHEDRMLNYDTERGGISVKTDLLKSGALSRLFIARAGKRDSGNYTCGMRNAQTSVTVHILNGEIPAAMQSGSSSRRVQSPWPLLALLALLALTQYVQQRSHYCPGTSSTMSRSTKFHRHTKNVEHESQRHELGNDGEGNETTEDRPPFSFPQASGVRSQSSIGLSIQVR